MRTPQEIREMEFTKAPMGGYKQSEVETFLEETASEIEYLRKAQTDAEKTIKDLTDRIEQSKLSQDGLQQVLICAQRVADEVSAEAQKRSEEIIANAEKEAESLITKAKEVEEISETKAKNLGAAAEHEAAQIISEAVKKSEEMLVEAKENADKMIAAAKNSVAEEQLLFDKLRLEVQNYKKAIELLCNQLSGTVMSFPEEVALEPQRVAEALEYNFGKKEETATETVEEVVQDLQEAVLENELVETEDEQTEDEQETLEDIQEIETSKGVLTLGIEKDDETDEEEEEEEEHVPFFRRRK